MEKVYEIYIRTTPERALGRDHRSGDPPQVQLRRRARDRLDAGHALPDGRARRAGGRLAEGESWRWTRRAGWCTP